MDQLLFVYPSAMIEGVSPNVRHNTLLHRAVGVVSAVLPLAQGTEVAEVDASATELQVQAALA